MHSYLEQVANARKTTERVKYDKDQERYVSHEEKKFDALLAFQRKLGKTTPKRLSSKDRIGTSKM